MLFLLGDIPLLDFEIMKKLFNLSTSNKVMWGTLVKRALTYSDIVQFNLLYKDIGVVGFDIDFNEDIQSNRDKDKFYSTGEVLSLPLQNCSLEMTNSLSDFDYWKNKFIEDPSFLKGGNEILACITHEDMVMVDMDYFGDLVDGIDLYDLVDQI
jgi:hypothetical protein